MNRYRIKIELSGGNAIDAKSVGKNQAEALDALMRLPQVTEFMKDAEINSVDCVFLEKVVPVSPDNYILQKSDTVADGWVVTDTENSVVVQFRAHQYNETAKITPLYDLPEEAIDTATILREIGEFLSVYHGDLL